MKIKRFIICFSVSLVFFMAVFVVFNNDKDTKVTGKITLWTQAENYDHINELAQKFVKSNEKCTVEVVKVDDYEFDSKINEGIASNKIPDIVTLDNEHLNKLFENYKDSIQIKENDKIIEDYSKNFTDRELQEITVDNRILGVPFSSQPLVLYIREDMLKEYGYTSADINTWEDLIKIGKDIFEKSSGKVRVLNATSKDYNYLISLLIMQEMQMHSDAETVRKNVNSLIGQFQANNVLNYDNGAAYLARISSIEGMSEIMQISEKCEWVANNPPANNNGNNKFYISGGNNLVEISNNDGNSKLRETFLRYIVTSNTDLYSRASEGKFFSSFLSAYNKLETETSINNFKYKSPIVVMDNITIKAPKIENYKLYQNLKQEYIK